MRIYEKIHLLIAIIVLTIFLISGLYMKLYFPNIYHNDQLIRATFRSTHIYILFNGLCNLLLGTYSTTNQNKKAYILQIFSSSLIVLGAVLLNISFFFLTEKADDSLRGLGVIVTTVGVVGHTLARNRENKLT